MNPRDGDIPKTLNTDRGLREQTYFLGETEKGALVLLLMNVCVLFRSGVSRSSSSMFRLRFCSRFNYWFMIFDGIEAKVWSGTGSDAPRPLEDTVDF